MSVGALRLSLNPKTERLLVCGRFGAEVNGWDRPSGLDASFSECLLHTHQLLEDQEDIEAGYWWCGRSTGMHGTSSRPQRLLHG